MKKEPRSPMRDNFSAVMESKFFTSTLPLLAVLAVILAYFWFVFENAANIPFQDDIYDVLLFLQRMDSATGLGDAISELYSQYNDHRTTASRLQIYAAYLVQGEIDFRTLAILANLGLILILFLFYLSVRNQRLKWIYMLVVALLLLNIRPHQIVLWGQPGFAYFYSIFYTFAGIYALHRVTLPKFILGASLCTLASFTLASGHIAWLMGLFSLAHQSVLGRSRSYLYPLSWILVAAAILFVWSIGYVPFSHGSTPEELLDFQEKFPQAVFDAPMSEFILRHIHFLTVLLGSAVTQTSDLLAAALGVLLLSVLLFATFKSFRNDDIRLVLCCWSVVATVAAVTLGRAPLGEPIPMLLYSSRYALFSVVLIGGLVMWMQQRLTIFRTPLVFLLVFLSAIYAIFTFHHFRVYLANVQRAIYHSHNVESYSTYSFPLEETNRIVRDAIESGRYNPPCRPFPTCKP